MQEIPKDGKVVRCYLQEQYQLLQALMLYTPIYKFLRNKKRKHIKTSAVSFFLNMHKESNAVKKGVVAPIA